MLANILLLEHVGKAIKITEVEEENREEWKATELKANMTNRDIGL